MVSRRVPVAILVFALTTFYYCNNGLCAEPTSKVSITAYACARDSQTAPTLSLLTRLERPGDSTAIRSTARNMGGGLWALTASVPLGFWFIMVRSPHCSAVSSTISIDGEPRSYVVALAPGIAGGLDSTRRFLAGVLPFDARAAVIYASKDGAPVDETYPGVEGRYFYFGGMKADSGVLVVQLGTYQIVTNIHLPAPSVTASQIVRITNEDIEKAIAAPSRSFQKP